MGWEIPVLEGYRYAIELAKALVDLGFDELVAKAIREPDTSKQIELLEKMEKLLYADAVQIPLWTNPMFNINSKKVHDVKWFTVGEPKFDFGKAWIEK